MIGSLLIAVIPLSTSYAASEVSYNEVTSKKTINTTDYRVKTGDSLYIIANRYGIRIETLMVYNNLSTDRIYTGQKLSIPNQPPIYKVEYADTLFHIANFFNVTVEQLKRANRLSDNTIYPGQNLRIPTKQTINMIETLPDSVLEKGFKDDRVAIVQNALSKIGYKINVDGIYGNQTQSILKDFQNKFPELINDGVYGPNTKWFLSNCLLQSYTLISFPRDLLVVSNKYRSLPSDYSPGNLVVPNIPFPFEEYNEKKLMREDAALAIEKLFESAKANNIDLYGLSGYRSYNRQNVIFTANVENKGLERANKFSAKPGESEHQTGLAIDITSPSVNFYLTQGFGETKEGIWLAQNAHLFGFILRYPKGAEYITGYQYEPWHIRYIGEEAAKEILEKEITLEEYMGYYK